MTYKIKFKQIVDALAIKTGMRNPGSRTRHNWVASGQHNTSHHDNVRRFQINFLKAQGLLPDSSLLEIGCGTLRGGIPIIDYLDTGHYYGMDVRQNVIDEAFEELRECDLQHKLPNIFLFSDNNLQLNTKFDFIWSFQVFLHMNDTRLDEALRFASRHLDKDGIFLATALLGDIEEDEWQGFPVISRSLELYQSKAIYYDLSTEVLGSLVDLGYREYVPEADSLTTMMLKFTHKAHKEKNNL